MNEIERQRLAALMRRCRGNDSQEAFAAKVGVSQSTIGEWERGRIPNIENIERIAANIGLTPEHLLAEVYERAIGTIPPLLDQVRAASPAMKAKILHLIAEEMEAEAQAEPANVYSAASEPP